MTEGKKERKKEKKTKICHCPFARLHTKDNQVENENNQLISCDLFCFKD